MKDVYHLSPINKTAAKVVGSGFKYEPTKIVSTKESHAPMKTRSAVNKERSNPNFIDLSGMRFGRFVVVGISDEFSGRWVVRCDCGTYAIRSTKAVKNPKNELDRCEHCRHLAYLKRKDFHARTGKYKEWDK